MQTVWNKLISLEVDHEYGSLKNGYFSFRAAPETAALMRSHSILFRQGKNSMELIYAAEDDTGTPMQPITGTQTFRFYASLDYLQFHSITDIPFDASKIFYFSNITSAADGDELPLHSESPAESFTTDEDLYNLTGQHLTVNEESTESAEYTLINQAGNIIMSKTAHPNEGTVYFEYDFSHRTAGLYELRKNGIKVKSFYADNFLKINKAFAVVEFHTGEDVPDDYKFVDSNGVVTSRVFKLKFKSRSTHWRYFIIPKYTVLEEGDSLVVEGNSDITFSTGVSQTLPDGVTAYVFKSASVFPLSKEPQKDISLKKEDGVSKTLIDQLPTPGASSVMIEEEKVYSDIFVYI